jgi:adenylate cyclase
MFKKIKAKSWEWRGVLIAAPSITIFVLLMRFAGILEMLELAALDQLFLVRPREAKESRVVIVDLDESEVETLGKRYQWPLPDDIYAQALENLKQHNPSAIGFDIYRDFSIEPGKERLTKVFKSTPNLIGVQKIGQSSDSSSVAPPPILKELNQVGANDLPIDADGKIRRGMFYLKEKTGDNLFSFSLRLADFYLKDKNVKIDQTEDLLIKAGNVVFPTFKSNDGGYIRADERGYQVLLNYRGSTDSFPRISFMDVLENRIPPDLIRGRIVLIGTSAESLKDLFFTPYSSSLFSQPQRMPGVVIHANAISQILSAALDNRPIIKTLSEPVEWVWIFVWSLAGAIISWKLRHNNGRRSRYPIAVASLFIAGGCLVASSYVAFINGWWIPVVPSINALLLSTIAVTAYVAKTAGDIRKTFGRYLTDEVVANLLEHPEGLKLGGQRQKVTIMTSDLRGFTSTSERLPAEEVIKILNIYLGYMADVITQYQGTIDEFMGDGILILFGAPTSRKDDANRAIACAVSMQQAMEPVNEKMKEMGLPNLEMGIGINTGEVVVGNIGSEKRTKYGVVGSHVNLTYRIESYTVGGQILISESTLKEASLPVEIISERQVQPKGVNQPITIYDVGGIGGDFNLRLKQEEEEFFPLAQAISLHYAVLDGKDVSNTLFKGRLIKLSEKCAEVCCEEIEGNLKPSALTNLKMSLFFPDCELSGEDVYAKVSEKAADKGSFYIRFTNCSPKVTAKLSEIYSLNFPPRKKS